MSNYNKDEFKEDREDIQKQFEYQYMLLGRLKSDCDEYISPDSFSYMSDKRLWAGNTDEQISEMKKLWNEVPVKPEWLSMKDIEKYEKIFSMKDVEITKDNIHEYYEFMSGEDRKSKALLLDEILENRIDYVNFHIDAPFNSDDKSLIKKKETKDSTPVDNTINLHSITYEVELFGVKDTLKPIDEHLSKIKESEAFINYMFGTNECFKKTNEIYTDDDDVIIVFKGKNLTLELFRSDFSVDIAWSDTFDDFFTGMIEDIKQSPEYKKYIEKCKAPSKTPEEAFGTLYDDTINFTDSNTGYQISLTPVVMDGSLDFKIYSPGSVFNTEDQEFNKNTIPLKEGWLKPYFGSGAKEEQEHWLKQYEKEIGSFTQSLSAETTDPQLKNIQDAATVNQEFVDAHNEKLAQEQKKNPRKYLFNGLIKMKPTLKLSLATIAIIMATPSLQANDELVDTAMDYFFPSDSPSAVSTAVDIATLLSSKDKYKWDPNLQATLTDGYINAPKASSSNTALQSAATLLGGLGDIGGDFLTGGTASKVNFVTGALNEYMSGNLENIIMQETTKGLLPDEYSQYFDICYEKQETDMKNSPADLCALIPENLPGVGSGSTNPCDASFLPQIPGHTKLDSDTMELKKLKALYLGDTSQLNELSPMEKLKQRCSRNKSMFDPAPLPATSIADKVKDNNPVLSAKLMHRSASNTNVKQVLSSGKLTPAYIASLNYSITDKTGKTKKIYPYEGLENQAKPKNQQVYSFLLEKAKSAALEGATPDEVEDIIMALALNPDLINTSFENQLEREMAIKDLADSRSDVVNIESNEKMLIDEAVQAKESDSGTTEEIVDKYVGEYENLVSDKISYQIEDYRKQNASKHAPLSKDTLSKVSKTSKNPLFDKMALMDSDAKAMNEEADTIANFKKEGARQVQAFELKLRSKLKTLDKWEDRQGDVMRKIGFAESEIPKKPEGETVDEMVSNANKEVATQAATEQMQEDAKNQALEAGSSITDSIGGMSGF